MEARTARFQARYRDWRTASSRLGVHSPDIFQLAASAA